MADELRALPAERLFEIALKAHPRLNRFIPHAPTVPQKLFLLLDTREAFYGGAAGGGKSDALLMAALQYVDVPGYAALLLRRSFADLALPGALLDRAREWLSNTDARWSHEEKTWHFPAGGSLTFGYLEHDKDVYRYQSAEFQFVGFDELTQFSEWQWRYMNSRTRRLAGSRVPIRMRGASNPGNEGHEWVDARFVRHRSAERPFIPAKLEDNPHVDRAEYVASLSQLDPYNRALLLEGDWNARKPGKKFKREWWKFADVVPIGGAICRYWDLAATEPKPGKDPDYTAGAKVTRTRDGLWFIEDIRRDRLTPLGVERLIRATAEQDGRAVPIWIEQEPGSSGVNTVDHYVRNVLSGFTVRGMRPTGPKEVRANPVASQAEAGNVHLARGPWVGDFLDEAENFPGGKHDDQVDAVSGCFEKLTTRGASWEELFPEKQVAA
jgi:predicted phage terminase large subunit-like protein